MVVFLSTITQSQTTTTYDELGRVTAIEHPDGTQVSYTYDNVGNRHTHIMNTPQYWTGSTSTDWHATSNWGRGTIPQSIDNVIINSGTPNDPQINSNQSVSCNKLTVNNGATLTIKSAEIGSGSLIVNSTVTNKGIISVERYFIDNSWHFVSPSTTGVTANDFYWNDAPKSWLTYYTESTGEWTYNTELSTPMPVGQGWSVWLDIDTKTSAITTMTGDIRTTDLSVTLSKSSTGWNLIGNPFTSAIDWDEGTWGSNTTGTVYVWDNDYNGGDYRTWNGSAGDLTDGVIPISQGFFVQATSSGSFTIPAASRVHSSGFYKSEEIANESPYVKLQMDFGNHGNTLFIGFPENGTSQFDLRGDANKYNSYNDLPQIYVLEHGNKLSTNALAPLTEESKTVPLCLDQVVDGEYKFTLSQIDHLPNVTITLEDLKTETNQDLIKEPIYSFTASAGDEINRFLLHFKLNAFGIDHSIGEENQLVEIYSYAKRIYIRSKGIAATESGHLEIFNISGQLINKQTIGAKTFVSFPINTTKNYLIVKLTKASGVTTRKVLIN
jgi:YD repeat-containing protein